MAPGLRYKLVNTGSETLGHYIEFVEVGPNTNDPEQDQKINDRVEVNLMKAVGSLVPLRKLGEQNLLQFLRFRKLDSVSLTVKLTETNTETIMDTIPKAWQLIFQDLSPQVFAVFRAQAAAAATEDKQVTEA